MFTRITRWHMMLMMLKIYPVKNRKRRKNRKKDNKNSNKWARRSKIWGFKRRRVEKRSKKKRVYR